jgi:hypothetical protein
MFVSAHAHFVAENPPISELRVASKKKRGVRIWDAHWCRNRLCSDASSATILVMGWAFQQEAHREVRTTGSCGRGPIGIASYGGRTAIRLRRARRSLHRVRPGFRRARSGRRRAALCCAGRLVRNGLHRPRYRLWTWLWTSAARRIRIAGLRVTWVRGTWVWGTGLRVTWVRGTGLRRTWVRGTGLLGTRACIWRTRLLRGRRVLAAAGLPRSRAGIPTAHLRRRRRVSPAAARRDPLQWGRSLHRQSRQRPLDVLPLRRRFMNSKAAARQMSRRTQCILA